MKNNKKIVAVVLSLIMLWSCIPQTLLFANEPDQIILDTNVQNGKVYCTKLNPASDEDVYLSCIPKGGYELESFYYIIGGTPNDLDSNVIDHELYIQGALTVGARFKEASKIYLQPETIKQLNRIADILEMTGDEKEEFKLFFASIFTPENFKNAYLFIQRLVEPLSSDYYDRDYLGKHIGLYNDDTFDSLNIDNYDAFYMKEVIGLLFFSYINEYEHLDGTSSNQLTYTALHNAYESFVTNINEGTNLKASFCGVLNCEFWLCIDATSGIILPNVPTSDAIDEVTPLYRTLQSLQKLQKYHDWGIEWYKNDLDRFDDWMQRFIGECIQGESTTENDEKYYILNDIVAVEAFDEWINEKEDFDSYSNKISNLSTHINELKNSVSGMETGFEKTKAQWKIIYKCALDLYALYDSTFYAGEFEAYDELLAYDFGDDIMDMYYAIKTDRTSDLFNYDTFFTNFLTCYERLLSVYYGQVSSGGDADVSAIKAYYNDLKDELFELNKPAPSHSSKSYKAKDENKTAEKVSGTGKKGSKRTITPIEGKKVASVIVKDKNGNKVDVTLNEDGTYTFIQPASDVTVEVNYKNREITLNIGSTEADVDGEKSNLDVAPLVRNDRTMLPIRFVAENLGAKVEWDEKSPDYVLITKGDIKIEITLGSDKAKVNGKEFTLDSVAFAENDRTYLPVRFVSEHLNAIVEWNEARPMEVKIYER